MSRRKNRGPDIWNGVTHQSFNKIPRLFRDCIITEKIDGTNALIHITDDGVLMPGSRHRWLSPDREDNYGFKGWCHEHEQELIDGLGPGSHYGEWWGCGIQRTYDMKEKVFSLFNTSVWSDSNIRPKCCEIVPVLHYGPFNTSMILSILHDLKVHGSLAKPGFMRPEGVVIFHTHSGTSFKVTLDGDQPKGDQVKID